MNDFVIAAPKAGVSGRFRIEKFKGGVCTGVLPWFDNLITDVGLDALASPDYRRTCSLGSGNATPQFTDVQLGNLVRSTTTVNQNTSGAEQTAPYRVWHQLRYVFTPTGSAYNISEVGVGPTETLLLSRTLIKDGGGLPTTLSILGDETVYVTHEFSIMVPTEDVTGTVVFTGNVGGTYDFICRAANCTNASTSGDSLSWGLSNSGSGAGSGTRHFLAATGTMNSQKFYTTPIGDVTSIPAGTAIGALSVIAPPYVTGSHVGVLVKSYGLSESNGNHVSQTIRIGPACYQIQFDPPIPKTSSRQLSLTFQHSWGRA